MHQDSGRVPGTHWELCGATCPALCLGPVAQHITFFGVSSDLQDWQLAPPAGHWPESDAPGSKLHHLLAVFPGQGALSMLLLVKLLSLSSRPALWDAVSQVYALPEALG